MITSTQKQHPDGFICREIRKFDGADKFQRHDPAGTGLNISPWTEWDYYCFTADRERLIRVFNSLAEYYRNVLPSHLLLWLLLGRQLGAAAWIISHASPKASTNGMTKLTKPG
ncbi:MAG: hypothetical protein N2035_08910 [Chthoniobacterales bacterium]|nr:hypothetical protein [Chthoniobacterales bacterium]